MAFWKRWFGGSNRKTAAVAAAAATQTEAANKALAEVQKAQAAAAEAMRPPADNEAARLASEKRIRRAAGRGVNATIAGSGRALATATTATRRLMGE